MKILITGGAGFIGSHIVDAYVEKGFEVVVYDNFSSGTHKNIATHIKNKSIEVIDGDILNFELLNKSVKGCDFISHHAAQLEIFLAHDDPMKDLEVNTIGTLNVLHAAKKNNIKKVINVSSACVYGQVNGQSKETDDLRPNWDYGVSKLAAEKYGCIFNDYKDLPVVSLRYSIVYGEREWFRRALPIFLKRIIQNEPPVIFGKGNQERDFIYVKDVVDLNLKCLENDSTNGEIINVGSGTKTSIKDLAYSVCELKGNTMPLFEDTKEGDFSELIPGKKRNSSELKSMFLNISKAKELLNWEPQISLDEGLRREYVWAKENIDRWNKIYTTQW